MVTRIDNLNQIEVGTPDDSYLTKFEDPRSVWFATVPVVPTAELEALKADIKVVVAVNDELNKKVRELEEDVSYWQQQISWYEDPWDCYEE